MITLADAQLLRQCENLRVVVPQMFESTSFAPKDPAPEPKDAPLVEGDRFQAIKVPEREETGFTHFLDGSQRSWMVGYQSALYPVYMAHLSAAILHRVERNVLAPTEDGYRLHAGIFAAFADGLDPLQVAGHLHVVDPGPNLAPEAVAEKLSVGISAKRDELEQALATQFEGGNLLMDGGIGKALLGPQDQRSIFGLVKSHRTQYFASADRLQEMGKLHPGYRTSVFQRDKNRNDRVAPYSFYLRLHESPVHGPFYGLVRIELPPHPKYLAMADEIAAWVLHERAPYSLPDPRYDRLLYPIRLIEMHLKALQPSEAWIRGLIQL